MADESKNDLEKCLSFIYNERKMMVENAEIESSILNKKIYIEGSVLGVKSNTDEILNPRTQEASANNQIPLLHIMSETGKVYKQKMITQCASNGSSLSYQTLYTQEILKQEEQLENINNGISLLDQIHIESSVSGVTSNIDEILNLKIQKENANNETTLLLQETEQIFKQKLDQILDVEVFKEKMQAENANNESSLLDQIHNENSVSGVRSDTYEILNRKTQEENANNGTPILHEMSDTDNIFKQKRQTASTPNESALLDQILDSEEALKKNEKVENASNENSLLDEVFLESSFSGVISDTDEILNPKTQEDNANIETPLLLQETDKVFKQKCDQQLNTEVFKEKMQAENENNECSLLDQIHIKSSVSSVISDTDEILNAKTQKGNVNGKTPIFFQKSETQNKSSLLDPIIDIDAVSKQKAQVENSRNESPLLDKISDEEICSQNMQAENIYNGSLFLDQTIDTDADLKQNMPVVNAQNKSSLFDQISDVSEVFKQNALPTTPPVEPRRTSVWKLFDPLHSMTKTKKAIQQNSSSNIVATTEGKLLYEPCEEDSINDSHNEGALSDPDADILISFESPKKEHQPLIPKKLFPTDSKSVKVYTEEEFQQILKSDETRLRKEVSDKQMAYEMQFKEKDMEMEHKLSKCIKMNKLQHVVLSEVVQIAIKISKDNKETETKLKKLASEKKKLVANIKISKEDLVRNESAFSEFHKRYEQCKEIIKTYKENEEKLKKNMEKIQVASDERGNVNSVLESRSHEILDKAKLEIENTKKSYETQTAVLEAQLKKAQMKMYSLESELDQVKSGNKKLGSIYDELVTKIGV